MKLRKATIEQWAIVPVMGLLWIVGLTYQSGIGIAYDVYGKTKLLTIGIFLFLFVFRGKFRRISQQMLLALVLIGVGLVVTYIRYEALVEDFLWVYLLIPLISSLPVEKRQMRWVSLMYGVLGGIVLFIANYGSLFRGWNENAVGMIAFFSYMVFIGAFSELRDRRGIFILVVFSLVYFAWMEVLNARSSALFSIVAFLCVFSIIPFRNLLRIRQSLAWILLAPLLIAVVVVVVKDFSFVEKLNAWSLEQFGKQIFNGRENIWAWGLRDFWDAPMFGHGTFVGNFHNSAVTVLYGSGIAGFVFWFLATKTLIRRALSWLNDSVVYGLLIAFAMIWLQQSLELGLIADQANIVPYGILGLLLGRIRTLERYDEESIIHSNPGL